MSAQRYTGAVDMARGMREPTANRIGDYLFNSDPRRIRSLGDLYSATMAADAAPALGTAATISAAQATRQRAGRAAVRAW